MTRSRYSFDEAKIQRFFAEGRGSGRGADYLPWLQIQDVPSAGRSHRPWGVKSRRVHHFLSDGEYKCFLIFEANPFVLAINEQFPLDRNVTYSCAQHLGVRHPTTLDGTPYVLTLDFLNIEACPPLTRNVPYTFKYNFEDLTHRENELLDITKLACARLGMELQLIDKSFFDDSFNINYDSVRAYYDISKLSFYTETDVIGLSQVLLAEVAANSHDTLAQVCRMLAGIFSTTPTIVYQIAMHMVARRMITVDLSSPVGLEQLPLSSYSVGGPVTLIAQGS